MTLFSALYDIMSNKIYDTLFSALYDIMSNKIYGTLFSALYDITMNYDDTPDMTGTWRKGMPILN